MGYALAGFAGLVLVTLIYLFRRSILSGIAQGQAEATLQGERERLDAMERAAAAKRAEQAKRVREEADQIRTARDAADFLRKQFPGSGTTAPVRDPG